MVIYVVKCKWCGVEFESTSPRAAYCSDECKREAKTRQQTLYRSSESSGATFKCIVCGKEFIKTSNHQLMCSRECKKKRDNDLERKRRIIENANAYSCPSYETQFDRSLKELKKTGETYAERQKRQTIEMFARLNTSPKK